MKKLIALIWLMMLVALAATCVAEVPQMINYQGILKNDKGKPVNDGDYDITFSIYNVETGGTPLWTETQTVTVTKGVFNVILGTVTPIDLAFDEDYWLGMTVAPDTDEMSPRLELVSAPYTFRAQMANEVEMNAVTSACILDGEVKTNDLASGSVSTEKIAGSSVTVEKLAFNDFHDIGGMDLVNDADADPENEKPLAGDDISVSDRTVRLKDDISVKSISAADENGLKLYDDGSHLGIFIQDEGNVGFGTVAPQGKLHIEDGTPGIILFDTDKGLSSSNPAWQLRSVDSVGAFVVQSTVDYSTYIDRFLIDIDGNVGIGTASPDEKLHVAGTVKIVDGNQGEGKVLTSDANGVASWQAPPGSCLPSGVIVMWSGSIASIPAGWALCDGNSGTPDLRDRFIVGASQDDGGVAKTNITGTLTQTGGSLSHSHSGSTSADVSGDYRAWNAHPGTSGYNGDASRGWHTHSLTINPADALPPYYTLAFIMKL